MLKKIKEIIKDTFTETEQGRLIREERETKITNQKSIIETMICPVCGGKSFDKGYIHVSGS